MSQPSDFSTDEPYFTIHLVSVKKILVICQTYYKLFIMKVYTVY